MQNKITWKTTLNEAQHVRDKQLLPAPVRNVAYWEGHRRQNKFHGNQLERVKGSPAPTAAHSDAPRVAKHTKETEGKFILISHAAQDRIIEGENARRESEKLSKMRRFIKSKLIKIQLISTKRENVIDWNWF